MATLPRKVARRINDSKQLTPEERATLFQLLRPHASVGIAGASVSEIDAINILQATMLAMRRAFARLPVQPAIALIDGDRAPELPCPTRPIVDGDARSLSIAAASIFAKVTRDRLMAALSRRLPGYGWEPNAGYDPYDYKPPQRR